MVRRSFCYVLIHAHLYICLNLHTVGICELEHLLSIYAKLSSSEDLHTQLPTLSPSTCKYLYVCIINTSLCTWANVRLVCKNATLNNVVRHKLGYVRTPLQDLHASFRVYVHFYRSTLCLLYVCLSCFIFHMPCKNS